MLYKKEAYDQASLRHWESIEIDRYTFPNENDFYFANHYNNIGKVFYRMRRYEEVGEYCDKALIALRTLSQDHIDIAYTLKNKDELMLAQNNLDESFHLLNCGCKQIFCHTAPNFTYVSMPTSENV